MENKIIQIVSQYTGIPEQELNDNSCISRKAVANSIVLHRMYAALASEGFAIEGYQTINTFGELLSKIDRKYDAENTPLSGTINFTHQSLSANADSTQIGIDMEEIAQMPVVPDFREEEFYTMNFAPQEIAYCILQPNPYASFAGLFAAKEAIVKAGNHYRDIPFNKILIDHLPEGQPVFKNYTISISHTDQIAIAVAVNIFLPDISPNTDTVIHENKNSSFLQVMLSLIAIILSAVAISIYLFKK